MIHDDHDFAFLPNGSCRKPCAPINAALERKHTPRTLDLHTESRKRGGAHIAAPAMTSTALDAVVGIACLVFAAIATAGWALPALLRVLGFAAGAPLE